MKPSSSYSHLKFVYLTGHWRHSLEVHPFLRKILDPPLQEFQNVTPWRLKNPTCRAYIFERLLSHVFNQINNSIMVLIETVGQKTKIRDSETSRPKIRHSETKRNTRKRDFETHSNHLRDSRLEQKFPRPWIFRVPFATPHVHRTEFLDCVTFKSRFLIVCTRDLIKFSNPKQMSY